MTKMLTEAQLMSEVNRCEFCEEKPCKKACPADCSPADFIMAMKTASSIDYSRSASLILGSNPLGGVCGAVCYDHFCQKACVHHSFDHAIQIPQVQATIIEKAKQLKGGIKFAKAALNHKKVAIIGAGPSGLSAAAVLAQKGYTVEVYEKENEVGGKCNLIPETKLDKKILRSDIEFIKSLGAITIKTEQQIVNPEEVLNAGFDAVIVASGGKKGGVPYITHEKIFYANDAEVSHKSVVEAVAAGKNAAILLDAYLTKQAKPQIENNLKSTAILQGQIDLPVSLAADFFGRPILSPFLLSAAPHSDGYENMKKAYLAGWSGGVMKTAFDGVPIHIPSEYMFAYNQDTYANCDNVSGHPLDRVCREIGQLIREFPDRLTIGATGGPVTGNDEFDRKGWQANTLKLERSGAMGVEYSLSCPQGGDGTEGDIVSQNAKLTAKIIDWIMEVSDPNIPKLFKLTAAVTSIYPIVTAIKAVLAKYPNKKAGITLANSFPTLALRQGNKKSWEEGMVVGMSGDGVKHISFLTLANVAPLGVTVSGNGGPMDYKAAADFLALGVKTVQFCTILMKYGVHIIDHLHSGLSYLMQDRGIKSVHELIGIALPKPVTGFMELSAEKKISAVHSELCEHCGNCTRCPYLAITLNAEKIPEIDPSKCIGCSICAQKCFAKALYMRKRTAEEAKLVSD